MPSPTVIIGSGLAGLSCAYHLGQDYLLLEKSDGVGGVARTFRRGNFLFDCTGHWLHFRDAAMRQWVQELLGDDLLHIQRRAAIFSHGVLTPYPFQANTHGLPPRVIADCILGYFKARETALQRTLGTAAASPPPSEPTFEAYIRNRMGDGIAEHFMIPYNTKLWTVPPAAMSSTWCARFVPLPSPEEVVYGALQPTGAGHQLGYNTHFYYPRQGGIGRLPEALKNALHGGELRTQSDVVGVNWRAKRIHLHSGEPIAYETLVSTMPLRALVACLIAPPEAVVAAGQRLRSADVTYWDIGLARPNDPSHPHWIYFPEADVPFYRVGSATAAVPSLAPTGHRSYYVEVSHPSGTPCHVTDAQILAGMRRVGLIAADEEPTVMQRTTLPSAYVIMDHAYGEARQTVLDWLMAQNIRSIGRYGSWTYDSMEGALLQGRDAAHRILHANA